MAWPFTLGLGSTFAPSTRHHSPSVVDANVEPSRSPAARTLIVNVSSQPQANAASAQIARTVMGLLTTLASFAAATCQVGELSGGMLGSAPWFISSHRH